MKFIFRSVLLSCIISTQIPVIAQDNVTEINYPEIGKPCPDFVLNNVQQYPKKTVSLKSLKGKYFILDFFSSGCSSCVESFPKTNTIYSEFKDRVEILMVGKEDKYLRSVYERYRDKQNLQMPVAYDSGLCTRWMIEAFPTVLWVDKEGIVRASTIARDINAKNIQLFLEGKTFDYFNTSYTATQARLNDTANETQSFLMKNPNVLVASVLSRYDGNTVLGFPKEFYNGINKFEARETSLSDLYRLAYYANASLYYYDSLYSKAINEIVLEIDDKSLFQPDWKKKANLFDYYQVVPNVDINSDYRQKLLQQDLKKAFGYVVTLEKRKVPVWELTCTEKARKQLQTKGGKRVMEFIIPHVSYRLANAPMMFLIGALVYGVDRDTPILDATGIVGNIDIELNCIWTDPEDVKKALKRNGLELIKTEKEMTVLVIRDPVQQ